MNLSNGRQIYAQVLFSRERVHSFHQMLQKVSLTAGLIQSPVLQMEKLRPRAGMLCPMSHDKLVVALGPLLLPRELSAVTGNTFLSLQRQAGN